MILVLFQVRSKNATRGTRSWKQKLVSKLEISGDDVTPEVQ